MWWFIYNSPHERALQDLFILLLKVKYWENLWDFTVSTQQKLEAIRPVNLVKQAKLLKFTDNWVLDKSLNHFIFPEFTDLKIPEKVIITNTVLVTVFIKVTWTIVKNLKWLKLHNPS